MMPMTDEHVRWLRTLTERWRSNTTAADIYALVKGLASGDVALYRPATELVVVATEPLTDERVRTLRSLIEDIADGSLRCADSKTQRVVEVKEIEEVVKRADWITVDAGHDGNADSEAIRNIASRWLSTPEQPETAESLKLASDREYAKVMERAGIPMPAAPPREESK